MKQPLLITDKQPAIRIDFKPCKDKPNHTTCEHSEESHMATFHKQPPGVSLHATLTLRSIPLVSRAPTRVLPDAPRGLIKLQRRLQQLRVSWYLRVTSVYRSHKTACD